MRSCIVCDIVAGLAPASVVHRDDHCLGFMDIHPVTPGHILIVPLVHAAHLADVDSAVGGRLFATAQRLAASINFFLADGAAAGQEVFHVHLHVFPRFAGDGFGLRFPPEHGKPVARERLDQEAAAIAKALRGAQQPDGADAPTVLYDHAAEARGSLGALGSAVRRDLMQVSGRYGLVPLHRWLAERPLLHVGIGYSGTFTVAVILKEIADRSRAPFLAWIAWLLALVAFSLFFTNVTWYRDDDNLAAAVLIVVTTGIAALVSFAIAGFIFTGSLGAIVFTAAGAFFTLIVRVIIFVPVTVALVWVGRRLRRYFAPATMNDEHSST